MSAVALIAGDAHPELAREIARSMGRSLVPVSISAFADGETRVRIEAEVRDADLYIVQPTSVPSNERLMTLALLADAARAAGAGRITAVMPYFGYARQDVRKSPGEPRSAQLAGRILRCAGVERMVALEEELLQALGVPYRAVDVAAGDLGASAVRKIDLEAWFPSQGRYREVTSCSNTTDFQARRLGIRWRSPEGLVPPHTLNGTVVTDRVLLAILETYEGLVPEALHAYGAPTQIGGSIHPTG